MEIFESEFFKNNLGQKSMSRLLPFLSFFPATAVLLYIHSVEALTGYIGTYAISYLGGKGADCYSSIKGKK